MFGTMTLRNIDLFIWHLDSAQNDRVGFLAEYPFNPRPPETFFVTRPPKRGLLQHPFPGFSILNAYTLVFATNI